MVVVGASSGIGAETATQCARAGAKVSICARREDCLRQVIKNLPGQEEHGYAVLDVRETQRLGEVFDRFVQERGPIGGLVYATGISKTVPFNLIDTDEFLEMLKVNLVGAMECTQTAIKVKRVSKLGCSVVWLSSIAYRRPTGAGTFMYSASKAGLMGGVRTLVAELARRKIRINAVCPGAVKTEMWNSERLTEEQKQAIFGRYPLGIGDPTDVANACVFLLSPAARWITGIELVLDGGFSVA